MSDDIQALQDALAAEHAAIWAYGVVGAHVGNDLIGEVGQIETEHRGRRAELEELIRDLGALPVASQGGYQLPIPVADQPSALAAAAALEDALAQQWRFCTGRTTTTTARTFVVDALIASAHTGYRWRRRVEGAQAPTVAFPGL